MRYKNILGFSLGPIITALIGFISVPLLTRLVAPDLYALVSLAQVTIQLFLFFCLAGYDQAYAREFLNVSDNRKLLLHTMVFNMAITMLAISILYIYSEQLSTYIFGRVDKLSFVLLLSIVVVSVILRYVHVTLRMAQKGLTYSIFLIIQAITNLTSILALILFFDCNALHSVLSSNLLSISIVLIISITKLRRFDFSKVELDPLLFKQLTEYSLPLLFSSLLMWVLYSSDQYMLRYLSNLEELGLYAASYKLCAPLLLLQTIVSTFWVPLTYKWEKEGRALIYYERSIFFAIMILCVCFLVAILSKDVLIRLLGDMYINAIDIFPYLLIYPIYYIASEVSTFGISIARKTKYLVPISFFSAIVNITSNFALIPILGAKGAAISTAITFVVYFYLRLYVSQYIWKKLDVKSVHLMTLVGVVTLLVNEFYSAQALYFTLITLLLSYVIIKERKFVRSKIIK